MCVYMYTCICLDVSTEFAAHSLQFFLQDASRLVTVLLPALTLLVQPMPRALDLCAVLHSNILRVYLRLLFCFVIYFEYQCIYKVKSVSV